MEKYRRYLKPPLTKQERLLTRLSELISAGFNLVDALEIMETLMDTKIINSIRINLTKGDSFSSILKSLHFKEQIVYIIHASETHYALEQGISRSSKYIKQHLANKTEFSKKMKYPIFLLVIIIFALSALMIFFLPQIDDFYQTFGIENNQSSIIYIIYFLIGISAFIAVIFTLLTFFLKFKSEKFQNIIRRYCFKIPLLKKIVTSIFSYYFASQIEMFISCGLSFKESLQSIQKYNSLPVVKIIASEVESEILQGRSLELILKEKDCFTPYFRLISLHALKIGNFETEIKNFVTKETVRIQGKIHGFIKAMQTILLILVGIIISMLYLSILQPVFDLINIM